MSGRLEGGRGYPFAGPLGSSGQTRNRAISAAIRRLVPMTLSVPSFLSFFLFFASPDVPRRLLPAPIELSGGGA